MQLDRSFRVSGIGSPSIENDDANVFTTNHAFRPFGHGARSGEVKVCPALSARKSLRRRTREGFAYPRLPRNSITNRNGHGMI